MFRLIKASAALGALALAAIGQGKPVAPAPRIEGASEYVNRLLSPARPIAEGKRIDLWMARERSPLFDGNITRDEWSAALEINLAFLTEEKTGRGFAPRVAICLAPSRRAGCMLVAMACEDDTLDVVVDTQGPSEARSAKGPANDAQAQQTEGSEPAPEDPYLTADRCTISLVSLEASDGHPAVLTITRTGETHQKGDAPGKVAVAELDGLGWALEAEIRLPVSPGQAERSVGLYMGVHNGAMSKAIWPLNAAPETTDTFGKLVLTQSNG